MKKPNTKKLIASIALSAVMLTSTLAVPVNAAWKTTSNGVQWTDSKGKTVKSKWITAKNGNKYYINSKGYRVTGLFNLKQSDGTTATYYFDKNGVMQTGWRYINKKYYYFQSSGKAVKSKKVKIGSYSYKFDKNGKWDGKVYNGSKNVTSKVDIYKLTGVGPKQSSTSNSNTNKNTASTTADSNHEYLSTTTKTQAQLIKELGTIPKTVTICGYKIDTSATRLPTELLNSNAFLNATDKDLENLKYLTKLESLTIWSGNGTWQNKMKDEERDCNGVHITNVDFCLYMPNLKKINLDCCTRLTDLSGLRKCAKLTNIELTGLASLENLNSLDTFAKQGHKFSLSIFFPTVKNGKYGYNYNYDYKFNDWYAYKRYKNCSYYSVTRGVEYDYRMSGSDVTGGNYYRYKTNSFTNTSTYKGNLSRAKTILQLSQQTKNVVAYGYYSETLVAAYGKAYSTRNKADTNKWGSGTEWSCGVMRIDNSKNKEATKKYMEYMNEWGVLDLLK